MSYGCFCVGDRKCWSWDVPRRLVVGQKSERMYECFGPDRLMKADKSKITRTIAGDRKLASYKFHTSYEEKYVGSNSAFSHADGYVRTKLEILKSRTAPLNMGGVSWAQGLRSRKHLERTGGCWSCVCL